MSNPRYMNKHSEAFLEEMKEILLAEKKRLENELNRFAKPTDEKGDYRATFENIGREPEDNAHEVENYQSNLAMEKTLEGRLGEIVDALARIEQGSYGISEKTGELIPEERLRAFPEAKSNPNEEGA